LVSITVLGVFSVKGLSAETLDFAFENDNFYNSTNPVYDSSYNVRNQTSFTGNYPATYSFENDDIGSVPNNWVDISGTGCEGIVIDSFVGHDKVLQLNATGSGNIDIYTEISKGVNTVIEFWMAKTSISGKRFEIWLYEGNSRKVAIRFDNDDITYWDGTLHTIILNVIDANVFFHCKIELNDTANTFGFYLNGVFIGEDYDYENPSVVGVDEITIMGLSGGFCYFDAIGYSWEGDNYLESIDYSAGSYSSGAISDTYYNDSNSLVVDSQSLMFEEMLLDLNFMQDVIGLFDLYITCSLNPDIDFSLIDGNNDVIVESDTDVLFLNSYNFTEITELTLRVVDTIVPFTISIDYLLNFNESSYNIGDNIVPLVDANEGVYTPDKYDFYYEGEFDHFDNGDDDPNGWDDVEMDGDDVNCLYSSIVEILADSGETNGLEKDDFSIENIGMLNTTFGFNVLDSAIPTLTTRIDMLIYSYDSTELVQVYIDEEGEIGYHDGSNYIVLDDGLTVEDVDYDINVYIDYEIDLCIMGYSADGVFIDDFMFPLQTTGKEGLSKIRFTGVTDLDGLEIWLDYIGVYVNGSSITTEFATMGIDVCGENTWIFDDNNLVSIDIVGNHIITYLFSNASIGAPGFAPETLIASRDYNGTITVNLYDYLYDSYWGYYYIAEGLLSFLFYNQIELNALSIDGAKLTEGTNEYFLEFDYGSVLTNESYFWVDSNHKLQFSLVANDDNTEYIQASFDINDVASENRSIRFSSNINGNAQGYFSVDYTDSTDSLLELPYYATTTVIILPQTRFIDEFTILITDNDLTDSTTCTGYIFNPKLIYYPDLQVSVDTLSLLAILVPLIVMIVPPIAMYKKLGSVAILPTFLLMALVCVATGLIPVWMFFIIALSSVGFIVMKKEMGDE